MTAGPIASASSLLLDGESGLVRLGGWQQMLAKQHAQVRGGGWQKQAQRPGQDRFFVPPAAVVVKSGSAVWHTQVDFRRAGPW